MAVLLNVLPMQLLTGVRKDDRINAGRHAKNCGQRTALSVELYRESGNYRRAAAQP